jgi:predicted transcriptional regulator
MRYRSKTEIIVSILEITGSSSYGVTKTKIMYKVFLSYGLLQEYLTFLRERGLIEVKEAKDGKDYRLKTFFRSTDRGRRVLYLYRKINEMISVASKKNNSTI